jgi:N-acetylglucosaminyl-diphospho-decaprenol L-rhamnosyltransferase
MVFNGRLNIAIVIVSYNSADYLVDCIRYLREQSYLPSEVIVVDNGSENQNELQSLLGCAFFPNFQINLILLDKNTGYSAANNFAFQNLSNNIDVVIFLNPDAYLIDKKFIEKVAEYFGSENSADFISAKLLRFNNFEKTPSTIIDSTGITQTWYGRWVDRGAGEVDCGQYDISVHQDIQAVCGAAFIAKKNVLDVVVQKEGYLFNESFFMYKEDIELSLRIRKFGFELAYVPHLVAYHCRGWQSRKSMSPFAKKLSARNDLIVAWRYSKKALPFTLLKYMLFFIFRV